MPTITKKKKSVSRNVGRSPIDWAARIRAANALFERMTPRERRVAICRDVIKSLNAGQFQAETGVYCLFDDSLDTNVDLMQNIEQGPVCQVCARGALFCSAVRKFDNCKTSFSRGYSPHDNGEFDKTESRFFSRKQIDLIEKYFEGWCRESTKSYLFKEIHPDNAKRMKLIMRNIIDNDGTFVPADLPME